MNNDFHSLKESITSKQFYLLKKTEHQLTLILRFRRIYQYKLFFKGHGLKYFKQLLFRRT